MSLSAAFQLQREFHQPIFNRLLGYVCIFVAVVKYCLGLTQIGDRGNRLLLQSFEIYRKKEILFPRRR